MDSERAAFPPHLWVDEDGMSWSEVSDETDSAEYVRVAWLREQIERRIRISEGLPEHRGAAGLCYQAGMRDVLSLLDSTAPEKENDHA